MISETEAMKRLIQKLEDLGYSKSDLRAEIQTMYGHRIDLVAYESSKPKIVFEVKTFPDSSMALASLDEEQLKYHPSVRQVQSLAKDMDAPYFCVYDGDTLLWFEIDEDGNPKKLQSPVLVQSVGKSKEQGIEFAHALYRLNDLGAFHFHLNDLLLHVGMSVFAWVLSKKGKPTLREQLLLSKPHLSVVDDYLDRSKVFEHSFSQEFYSKAFLILEQVDLPEDEGRNYVKILDDYLDLTFQNKRTELFKFPTWISEFMANLANPKENDVILDLYSNFDDIATACYDLSRRAKTYSFAENILYYVWANAKKALLETDLRSGNVYFGTPLRSTEYFGKFPKEAPSIVFVAPPFGARVYSERYRGSKLSEDIYIETAIELVKPNGWVVAIVPDGFLSSKSRVSTREFILRETHLRAMFSLDQFLPGTGIKTTILVVKKSVPQANEKFIFSRIQQSDVEGADGHSRSIQKGSRAQKILELYKKLQENSAITTRLKNVHLVDQYELTPSSWAMTRYVFKEREIQPSEHPLVRLGDIAALSKGAPLRLNKDNGTIPVIGPAAVRTFSIDQSKFDLTTQDLLSTKPVISKKGNILINAVGPYRGQAALITHDIQGVNISRNIIVVEKIKGEVAPEYLTFILNSRFVQQQLEELSTGSVIPQLSIGKIKELVFPLPALEEQRLIVEKVESIRNKINSAEKKVQEIQLEISELTKQLQSEVDIFQSSGEKND